MKTDAKKQLVLIGIRRKGDSGFRLKTVNREANQLKREFPLHNPKQSKTVGFCL
ncbi:MAG: hypothetical protein HQ517_18570 [SAR324 cluster bacterium]|nr:hypothetical protein [SAR324 cluster bacterium]